VNDIRRRLFKKVGLLIIKYFLTAGVLFIIFRRVNIDRAISLIMEADLKKFVFVFVVLCPSYFVLKIFKWRILLRKCGCQNSIIDIGYSFFLGFLLGIVTPGRIGELARIRNLEGDKYQLAGLVFYDRVLDLLAVIFLALCSVIVEFPQYYIFFVVFLSVFLTVGILFFRKNSHFAQQNFIKNGWRAKAQRFFFLIKRIDWRTFFNLFFLTIMAYVLITSQFVFIAASFTSVTRHLVFLVPIVMLINIVPLTVGGLGVREALFLFLLGKGGVVPGEILVNSSILWFTFNLIIGFLGFLAFFLLQKEYKSFES